MTSARGQFIARFFHDIQNKVEIDMYKGGFTHSEEFPYFGSCSGMGHDDQSIEETSDAITRLAHVDSATPATGGVTSLDAKGWDISVSRTLFMCDAWRRAHCLEAAGAPSAFVQGAFNLGLALSVHVLRSGMSMFSIDVYGIVGSGMISTTASNCFMRSFAHSEAFWALFGKVAKALANGDDCIGRDAISQAITEIWSELGLQFDDSEDTRVRALTELIEFTSHLYNVQAKTASYNNNTKLFLKLALMYGDGKHPTIEQIAGLRVAVRHTPESLSRLEQYVETYCPGIDGDIDWASVNIDTSLLH